MDFSIAPELAQRLDEVRAFVIERVQPLERQLLAGDWQGLYRAVEDCRAEVKARG